MTTQPEMSVPGLVMNTLLPLITHCPSTSSAVVCVFPASVPASGSLSPNAASRFPEQSCGSHSAFCSSVPQRWIGIVPSDVCDATVIASEQSTRASSSIASTSESVSAPLPPYSSGNGMPMSPISPSFPTAS